MAEELVARQLQIMDIMDKLLKNFKKDGPERKTPEYFKKKLDMLDCYWREFETNHELLISTEGSTSIEYLNKRYYDQTMDFYIRTKDYIQTKAKEVAGRPSTPILKQPVLKLDQPEQPGPSYKSQAHPESRHQEPHQSPVMVTRGLPSRTDELKRKQTSNFRAFSRTLANININAINEKWEFEDTLKTLHSRWSAIDSLHWELDTELESRDYNYEQEYNDYEQQYNQIKKDINRKMWSVSHKEKSTPQMEIPSFSGSYQHWTSFKDLFVETIHTNPSLSNAQKMQFLKGKVKGEAEKLIQHLSISSDNYLTCWDILNNRYNNKKLIFTSHLNTLLYLPTMQHQSSVAIKNIHDTTNECLHAIKNLDVDIASWDPILVHLLSQKLDTDTHNDYIESLKSPRELPVLADFLTFLEYKFTSLESSRRKTDGTKPSHQQQEPSSSSNKKFIKYHKAFSTKQNFNYKTSFNSSKSFNNATTKCPVCEKEHGIFQCSIFHDMKHEAKLQAIAKHNLCQNCLFDHRNKECFSQKRCRQCGDKHNTLLHDTFVSRSSNTNDGNNDTENNRKSSHVSQEDLSETLLATALINVQTADSTLITLRALIDQGSQTSLITENAAQMLRLPRKRCKGVIFGVGAKENNCKGVINIMCTAKNGEYSFNTDVYIMKSLINNLPNKSFKKPSWQYLQSISLADPNFNVSRPVDLLLGADIYSDIIQEGIIRPEKSQPVAQQTRLGWILCGNVQTFQCNVVLNKVDDIQRFWSIEDISESLDMSEEDQECLQYFKETTKRQEDGRYVVHLPLKSDFYEKLGSSKPMAAAQFRHLEKKFARQQELAKAYRLFIKEYQSLHHMAECTSNKTPSCYLPHHCVQRADSSTTALRVVFNASARTSSGYTLNDLMKRGPNLQHDLLSLILRWRQYRYAFTADIEKMFRQILVTEDHQHLQKILWRDAPDQLLREFNLTTVTYGTKAAPFLAMMTLKQLAMDEGHKYQESNAAMVLQEQFYMDDLVSGSFTLSSAKRLQEDLITLLQSGGFNLRKWSSNSEKLLQDVIRVQNEQAFDFKESESTKTLGLRWHPTKDEFQFQLKIDLTSPTTKYTKRKLLSDISKIFDPLGWLAPITTTLKLLFKQVWLSNIQWDDELPSKIILEWEKIKFDLINIESFRIPRWYHTNQCDIIQLHGFCDASIKAFACVIYCKVNTNITLIASKTRLIPESKKLTLPRLELSGAHLLSKLMIKVLQAISGMHINIYGWTDSTATLGWIQGETSRWKPFVANRVNQIKQSMPPDCWRYVKSSENPADCASRGISADQLKKHTLWWTGPQFLTTFNEQLETERPTYVTDQETKLLKQSNVTTTRHCDNDIIQQLIRKHSNLTRAIRTLAWILRIVLRHRDETLCLSLTELKQARHIIIKYVQDTEFFEEIENLRTNKQVDKKSKILSLNPFLDKHGLLRVGGRIKNANISEDMKHPIIIPHSHQLTDLIIDHAHKLCFHGGARLTLAFIRKQYWIISGNRAVKKRLHTCVTCKKQKASKQLQLMGDLPGPRINITRPFYHTGVDFTGYVDVKLNKGRGVKTTKGYVAVFICMATKAVHLELVSDMSTSAFMAALKRMSSRRGKPFHIYSDNGTNFVGANRALQSELINLQQLFNNEFTTEINELEIQWHFNAPAWPSAGGLWEAAVKSLKHHLRRVVGDQKLTFEEYSTLLAQLEGCLNSRPLCALTEDPDDLDYLTPSHFLNSGPVLTILDTETDERTRWQRTQKIYQDIWKRWQSEYLCLLSSRSKWKHTQANIKINDIVIIHQPNLPAGKWPLGRISELHPGSDGLVRVVTVKTKGGYIKRPITKLSPLLTSAEIPEKKEEKEDTLSSNKSQSKQYINSIKS